MDSNPPFCRCSLLILLIPPSAPARNLVTYCNSYGHAWATCVFIGPLIKRYTKWYLHRYFS